MLNYGFDPKYICMNGPSNNRSFLNMNFAGSYPIEMKTTYWTCPICQMIFRIGPSHTFKKIKKCIKRWNKTKLCSGPASWVHISV